MKTIFIIFLACSLFLAGCQEDIRISQTRPMLGTSITVTVLAPDKESGIEAVDSAFMEMGRVESLMNIYDADSPLSELNEFGALQNPSPEIIFVLERSKFFSEISDGAFDISVEPLLSLYAKSFSGTGKPPSQASIEKSKELVDYRKIRIDPGKISLEENMLVTLGGIAKGYAIDRGIAMLEKKGIERGLINAGGDVRALGEKEGGLPWTIGLQNPRNESQFITIINAADVAVATSGDYERYFDPSLDIHHIMDPRTGKSATEVMSVTIISPKAINADAMATAVFVLGPVEGMKLIERFGNAEGLIVTKEREVIRSSGFSGFEEV